MRRLTVTIAAVAAAAAFSPAPAGAAQDPPPCDPGPCIKDVLLEKVEDLG